MKEKTLKLVILLLMASLLVPSPVFSKRPTTEYEPFLSEKIKKARELERRGDHQGAEEAYLKIYRESKEEFKWRKDENTWIDYMASLRAIISFFYGQGNLQEVDWYFREYHHELEGDEGMGGMVLMLLQDVEKEIENLLNKKKIREAELIYLDLEENLGTLLGYQHFLLGELYKRMAAFYIKAGNPEEAKKYAERASSLMKD